MNWRRRLAAMIAPPDDWSTLPPLPAGPAPAPTGPLPAAPTGLPGLLQYLAVAAGGSPAPSAAALVWRWFDGAPELLIDRYLPERGRVAVVAAGAAPAALLRLRRPAGRDVTSTTLDGLRIEAVAPPTPRAGLPPTPRAVPPRAPIAVPPRAEPTAAPGRAASGRYDAVVLLETVGWLPRAEQAAAVARAALAVRPGGVLLLLERANRPRWRAALLTLRRRLPSRHPAGAARSASDWLHAVQAAGLRAQVVPALPRGVTPWCLVAGYRPVEPPAS